MKVFFLKRKLQDEIIAAYLDEKFAEEEVSRLNKEQIIRYGNAIHNMDLFLSSHAYFCETMDITERPNNFSI